MVVYETICPECKKKIIIEVSDKWIKLIIKTDDEQIREICRDMAIEYRGRKREAYDLKG